MPKNAVLINRPPNIFISSLVYAIIPLLVCFGVIYIKWHFLEEKIIDPLFIPIGIIMGLLLMPVHELLHAICYKKNNAVYIGISLKKFAAFAFCHEPISRNRFISMSLMPVLLGLIPIAVFLIAPSYGLLAGICVPLGIMGMLSPMPDYMDVHLVLKQVPKGSTIQSSNNGLYWY